MLDFETYVIGIKGSPRMECFNVNQEILNKLNPKVIDAVIVTSESLSHLVSEKIIKFQELKYARKLLLGEIGCAVAHRNAQLQVAQSSNGGFILEEDARLTDCHAVSSFVEEFLNQYQGEKAVLTFFDFRPWHKIDHKFRNSVPWLKSYGSPSSSLAYALTPAAAKELASANESSRYLADWPTSSCMFFISMRNLVRHDDENNLSIIDPLGQRIPRSSVLRRLSIITGIFYFTHLEYFRDFRDFIEDIWMVRTKFYLMDFRFKYLTMRFPERKRF